MHYCDEKNPSTKTIQPPTYNDVNMKIQISKNVKKKIMLVIKTESLCGMPLELRVSNLQSLSHNDTSDNKLLNNNNTAQNKASE